jgi:hypothetical protein
VACAARASLRNRPRCVGCQDRDDDCILTVLHLQMTRMNEPEPVSGVWLGGQAALGQAEQGLREEGGLP